MKARKYGKHFGISLSRIFEERLRCVCISVLLCLFVAGHELVAQDWPQILGPMEERAK
jgi:hypothetical protein